MTVRGAKSSVSSKRRLGRAAPRSDPHNRLSLVLIGLITTAMILGAQLFRLQAITPERHVAQSVNQRVKSRSLDAFRGQIVDRNGFVLASSAPSNQIIVDPSMIEDADRTAALLETILDVEHAELMDALVPSSQEDRYGLVARSVSDDVADKVKAMSGADATAADLVGVFVASDEDRVYPAGSLAAPIVGRVDPDNQGIFGLEKKYDALLNGIPGVEEYEGGRFGSISGGQLRAEPAQPGNDLILTIDHRIQFLVEKALVEHCEKVQAKGAQAVITEPASGNILAMVSVAADDTGCHIPNSNKPVVEAFEPGSVLKTITVAAAMEELGFTPQSVIEVPPEIKVGDMVFPDDPAHPRAMYSLSHIVAHSMNVGTIKLAQMLGPELVYEYQKRFGLGSATGLELPWETAGRVREPQQWWGSDAGSIPIGQGVALNATQLVAAYNAIANGGFYNRVKLVAGVQSPDGQVNWLPTEAPRQIISEQTAMYLTQLLSGVVNWGTGKRAAIDGYQLAGKTGTAWKVFDDGSGPSYGSDNNRRYVVTFAGFVPADDPQISMVIVVDEPLVDYSAATVVAPLFAEVGLYVLQVMGVVPDQVSSDGRVRAPMTETPLGHQLDGSIPYWWPT